MLTLTKIKTKLTSFMKDKSLKNDEFNRFNRFNNKSFMKNKN